MDFDKKRISDYCITCGECCRTDGYVFLTEDDALKIAEFLNINIYQFTEKYCEIINRKKLALKNKKGNKDCIFLENNRCTIYDVRPEQCVKFPYEWTNDKLPEKCIYNNYSIINNRINILTNRIKD